jgi:hypothetical protein
VVIFRLAPGEAAPWDGRYRLVGHYGEPLEVFAVRRAGELLPLVVSEADEVWFVWAAASEPGVEAA